MSRAWIVTKLFLLVSTIPAAADVVEVGPFTGGQSEDLEDITRMQFLIDFQIDVFNGDATFVSMINDTTIHLWGGSCLGNDCTIPRSGDYLIGATTPQAIVFHTPAFRFGSYFTNISQADDATATFFDAEGNLIGEDVIEVPFMGTDWYWNGWTSDVPIGRIEIVGNGVLDGFLWLDDLELDTSAPCPADLDLDSLVGTADLLALLAAWGSPGADLDRDGTTGINDLLILLSAWGPCP